MSRFISVLIGPSFATASSTSAALKAENCAPQNSVRTSALLVPFLIVGQGMGIRLRPPDLVCDRLGIVGQIDARLVRGIGLRHLLGAVTQRHHARRGPLDERLGLGEKCVSIAVRLDGFCKVVVEFLSDVARQLQVLLLILSYWHMG